MVRVNKNDAFVKTISIAVLLCRYKHSSGRHKHSSRRSVSEAAPHFETYVCTDLPLFGRSLPLLWKKPSDSRKKPFDMWCSCVANAFQKSFGVIFFDVCHMYILGKLPDDITRSWVYNELECSAVLALSHRQLKLAYGKSELQLCSCYRLGSLHLSNFFAHQNYSLSFTFSENLLSISFCFNFYGRTLLRNSSNFDSHSNY